MSDLLVFSSKHWPFSLRPMTLREALAVDDTPLLDEFEL